MTILSGKQAGLAKEKKKGMGRGGKEKGRSDKNE